MGTFHIMYSLIFAKYVMMKKCPESNIQSRNLKLLNSDIV